MSVTAAVEQKLTQLKLSRLREVYPHWVKEAEAHQLGYLSSWMGCWPRKWWGDRKIRSGASSKLRAFPLLRPWSSLISALHPELKRCRHGAFL